MSRSPRRPRDNGADINLAPFMNMVVILIPLLLLSVVFVQVGVFNVSTDLVTPEKTASSDAPEPRRITLAMGASGVRISVDGQMIEPIERCSPQDATICVEEDRGDVQALFGEIRRAADADEHLRVESLVDEAMQAYDFRAIYNVLARLKEQHPDEERLILTADPDVPYALLVRALDVARYRLEQTRYTSDSQFWAAADDRTEPMFMDAVFAIAR